MKFNQIITHYNDEEIFYQTSYFKCYETIIKEDTASQKDMNVKQVNITLNCKLLSQSQFSHLQSSINQYIKISNEHKCCCPMLFQFDKKKGILDLMTSMPLVSSIDEYFMNCSVSQIEYNQHVNSSFDINKILQKLNISASDALYYPYGITFVNTVSSAFPQLKITPFVFLHSVFHLNNSQSMNGFNRMNYFTETTYSNTIKNIIKGNSSSQINNQQYNEMQQFDLFPRESQFIGKGYFGKIYKTQMLNGIELVVKESQGTKVKNLIKEYEILQMCNHPNIVKTYGLKVSSNHSLPVGYLLLEKCDMDLYCYLEQLKRNGEWLSYDEMESVLKQMVSSLSYLYKTFGIVHRDVKLSNFLVIKKEKGLKIKLCDFGLAIKEYQRMNEVVGTIQFVAPEILGECFYSNKSDVFSLGLCFYYILTKKLLNNNVNSGDMLSYYMNLKQIPFTTFQDKNCKLESICSLMLQVDPEKRIDMNQLNHIILNEEQNTTSFANKLICA